MLMGEF